MNPFSDNNLLQPFVWGKKNENRNSADGSQNQRHKLLSEIDKVRKRRRERENEVEEIERLRTEEQRLRESSMYDGWQKKEEDFHLEQTKQRSKLRLLGNREKPIDTIAKTVLFGEMIPQKQKSVSGFDLKNPLVVMKELSLGQLLDLLTDLESYRQLESSKCGPHIKYWTSLITIVNSKIAELTNQRSTAQIDVMRDVKTLLAAKSVEQLSALQFDIDKNHTHRHPMDGEYWNIMRQEIALSLAELEVESFYLPVAKSLADLKAQLPTVSTTTEVAENKSEKDFSFSDIGGSINEEEFEEMDGRDEVALVTSEYSWQDKHHPRKPRYFNRVKTGWDWNKYNQTHYDVDNPPPKVVQGYKFTLFYPDLMDSSVTPKYYIEACASDSKEFVVIRFHAGPPYEDVAFKIVNREWDMNRRSGFISVFERGVLQLHFNFKRAFYRR